MNGMRGGSKFYERSLELVVPILKLIDSGYTQTAIADTIIKPTSHVSYYVRKLMDMGYIHEGVRDSMKVLELTQAGRNFLDQYKEGSSRHQLPIIRVENIRFKAPVLNLPQIPIAWDRVQMNNWKAYSTIIDSVRVRLNGGKSPSIEFMPTPVDGDDYFQLHTAIVQDCLLVKQKVERLFNMQIGRLSLSSRAELVARMTQSQEQPAKASDNSILRA